MSPCKSTKNGRKYANGQIEKIVKMLNLKSDSKLTIKITLVKKIRFLDFQVEIFNRAASYVWVYFKG